MLRPFHLAFPVKDLKKTISFYTSALGCKMGRTDPAWADFDLFGHQIVAHHVESSDFWRSREAFTKVDKSNVPVPHFGIVLTVNDFMDLANRLRRGNVVFEIEPQIRFKGLPGEQWTMFFKDPSGNALEFKAFEDLDSLFKTD